MANATRICSFEECPRPFYGGGWCQLHYNRVRKHGQPEGRTHTRNQDLPCSVDECDRRRAGRDLCSLHYQRWQRHGDPLYERPVNLCAVSGCDDRVNSRGWCTRHYTRYIRYGSPIYRIRGEVVNGCRICPGCGLDKPVTEYSADTGRCRTCVAAERRVTRLAEVPVPLPVIHCIVCSEKFIPRTSKNYCCSNACSARRNAEWDGYRQRVDRNLEHQRKWTRRNPDIRVQIQARRRARQVGTQVARFGRLEVAARMAFFGNRCWMCGGAFECIDHVKPLSKGGPHLLANLRPACNQCNGSKSNKWEGVAALRALAA